MAECIVNHKPENLHILPVTNQVHGCQIGITHLILIFLKVYRRRFKGYVRTQDYPSCSKVTCSKFIVSTFTPFLIKFTLNHQRSKFYDSGLSIFGG